MHDDRFSLDTRCVSTQRMAIVNRMRTHVSSSRAHIKRLCVELSVGPAVRSRESSKAYEPLPRLTPVSFACVLVVRLASDPEPPRYEAQVVKVAPDFL